MAVNFQTSILSLTLPISCQICLGKVKQPVICANHHVFCSSCMEMWLKKASQCPSCRVPITAENPCREIIGGTNESEHNDNPSMRKCLRKTRGELLLREYEEEMEGLYIENKELKTKNQSLESQLKTALDPCSIKTVQMDDKQVEPYVLEEWTNKLQAATDVCDEVKQDMDKLKEANRALRFQNVDLVQENMRLKAEVVSRSPQKFGRSTVAALEATIQQNDRDVDHLTMALEHGDRYIKNLESRIKISEERRLEGNSTAEADPLTQQHKINMMMRSLSDNERESICSNPLAEGGTFVRNHTSMFMPSADYKELKKSLTRDQKNDVDSKSTSSELVPATPSSAFRSLTLRSPGVREKKVAFKPASHLRRLDFEELPSPGKSGSTMENQFSSLDKLPTSTDVEPSKSVFWGAWQGSKPEDGSSPSLESSALGATSSTLVTDEPKGLETFSDSSMDAAYLDKISELDCMMLDGESSSSRGSQLSLASSTPGDLDNTLVPEPQPCSDVSSSHGGKPAAQCDQKSSPPHNMGGTLNDKEDLKGIAEESFAALDSCRESDANVPDSTGHGGSSQTDELSFDLLQPTKRKSHSPFNSSSPTKLSKLM
ncbi:ORC ubiquitin ligase 1 [Dissostichus eleginoides]|uniref:ORC ubiquitin ligase 1 n=1 Tax=Dissostichus eleginoides TaxID=100907 RepID=A0AAD9FAD0_DISEL|nr:ORC ubiquitin ligase 1 [Dissostichus eleginoides]